MKIQLITNAALCPTFATDRELEFQADFLSNDEKEFTSKLELLYGKSSQSAVNGDPRSFVTSNEEVEFLGFHNDTFGILTEMELAYLDEEAYDPEYAITKDEILALFEKLKARFESNSEELKANFPKTEFFFTFHDSNIQGGLVLISFTPLEHENLAFKAPYESDTAMTDVIYKMHELLK
ncbi:hypothetical protein LMH73_011635 [Vibrio splendidus]|nr:hypothetical protein [Vibrio splendidus]MCC4883053.1 hypothetical protein [Vibrio splendidus]